MRQYFAVMAVLCLFLINGCAEIENESTSNDVGKENLTQDRVSAQNLSDYVQAQVQATTKPEKYMVYFAWPKIEDGKRIRIRQEQMQLIVQPVQTTFSHEVTHNQTITYTFDVLDSYSKVESTFSKQVKIPRDFVVRAGQSEFIEDQKLNIKRLFISSDVSLRTNGHNIEIITDELIADKGIIETFLEGTKAANSIDGKNAGELIIKSKSAMGQLKIIMRGEHGGDGLDGAPYGSRASDGAAPGSGFVECLCHGRNCPLMVQKFNLFENNIEPMACICSETGSDGGNGANGANGRDGGRAGNGGDSGSLKVEIIDGSAFLLQTESKIGFAGRAGNGGPGQAGGIALGTKTRCSGRVGSNGRSGNPGNKGAEGINGKQGLTCVYIATEGKNDCY